MRIRGICISLLCLSILMLSASCSEAVHMSSLIVHIHQDIAKTISPENGKDIINADVSHYRITVTPSEGSGRSLVFPKGNGSFRVSGLKKGLSYSIGAEALVDVSGNGDYTAVAAGSAGPLVFSGIDQDVEIGISELYKGAGYESGPVSAEIVLPFALSSEGTAFSVSWRIEDMDGAIVASSGDKPIIGEASASGRYILDISPDEALMQGSYMLFVSISGEGEQSGIEASGAEAMRLLPGLPAHGTIHLESADPSDFTFTISDLVGGDIPVESSDGSYVLSSADGTIKLEGLIDGYSVSWHVDGKDASGIFAVDASDPSLFRFSGLPSGTHTVIAVISDPATSHGIGSVMFTAVVPGSPSVSEVQP